MVQTKVSVTDRLTDQPPPPLSKARRQWTSYTCSQILRLSFFLPLRKSCFWKRGEKLWSMMPGHAHTFVDLVARQRRREHSGMKEIRLVLTPYKIHEPGFWLHTNKLDQLLLSIIEILSKIVSIIPISNNHSESIAEATHVPYRPQHFKGITPAWTDQRIYKNSDLFCITSR